jgi:hypothetical protein
MGLVIFFNMIVIIVETDHAAEHEGSLAWVTAIGWTILVTFCAELGLRLYVFKSSFWFDRWNIFDFVIVVSDFLMSIFGLIFGSVFPVSTLRVFRLCKLARVSKVFRVFPELRLMMAGLIGSIRAVFWGTVLLAFVLLVWAIVAVQFIHPLNKTLTEEGRHRDCERCPRAYHSVLEAVLTFSQQIVAGDSWGQATIPVIEHYPITAFYFMGVFLSVGIAVLNLILGIVVNVAQTEHERLKMDMADEKRMEEMELHNHLLGICREMDEDGSGELSEGEMLRGFRERDEFRTAFLELDIHEEDMPIVWSIMDTDRSGSVSYLEFVNQLYKMKTTDTVFMLAHIKHYITKVFESMLKVMDTQEKQLSNIEAAEQATFKKVEAEDARLSQMQHDIEEAKEGSRQRTPSDMTSLSVLESPSSKSPVAAKLVCESAMPPQTAITPCKDIVELKDDRPDQMSSIVVAEYKMCREVLDTVLVASQQVQSEWRENMQDLKLTLELHASSTSRLLSELVAQRPIVRGEELLALPGRKPSSQLCWGNRSTSLCTTVQVPQDDVAPTPPASKECTEQLPNEAIASKACG